MRTYALVLTAVLAACASSPTSLVNAGQLDGASCVNAHVDPSSRLAKQLASLNPRPQCDADKAAVIGKVNPMLEDLSVVSTRASILSLFVERPTNPPSKWPPVPEKNELHPSGTMPGVGLKSGWTEAEGYRMVCVTGTNASTRATVCRSVEGDAMPAMAERIIAEDLPAVRWQ